jgi:hypothetical protein|tara:strand:- start:47 stop:433 length:387 start_codon:yes stop_codon:yes gene_type:complete
MTIQDIFEEAITFSKACNLSNERKNEESYLYKGIKIMKKDNFITIFNTSKIQFDYKEIPDEDYLKFYELGFVKGVHAIVKESYMYKIEVLNKKIKTEINSRNNKKHYESLKVKRDNLINKYSNISKIN